MNELVAGASPYPSHSPGKQLADTLALATIPVLSKLDGANQ